MGDTLYLCSGCGAVYTSSIAAMACEDDHAADDHRWRDLDDD